MDLNENNQIETRIIKTVLSGRPKVSNFIQTMSVVLFIGIVTLLFWRDFLGASEMLAANKVLVFENGEWWRLFTATLIHQDLGHYLSNMLMLFIFGFFINSYFGTLIFPWVTFIAAGLVNAIAILTYGDKVSLLGASGLVFVLGGFWLCLYYLVQRQYFWFNRLLRVIGIGMVLFFPSSFVPQTSYRTHLFGFIIGILLGIIYFLIEKQTIRKQEVHKVIYLEAEDLT